MKLPNAENAVVPEEKIKYYLLNLRHEEGKGKAKFFIGYGYTLDRWEILKKDLLRHVAEYECIPDELTEYGKKYIIEGHLRAPDGRSYHVRSVWMVYKGKDFPELKTAYPRKEGRRR